MSESDERIISKVDSPISSTSPYTSQPPDDCWCCMHTYILHLQLLPPKQVTMSSQNLSNLFDLATGIFGKSIGTTPEEDSKTRNISKSELENAKQVLLDFPTYMHEAFTGPNRESTRIQLWKYIKNCHLHTTGDTHVLPPSITPITVKLAESWADAIRTSEVGNSFVSHFSEVNMRKKLYALLVICKHAHGMDIDCSWEPKEHAQVKFHSDHFQDQMNSNHQTSSPGLIYKGETIGSYPWSKQASKTKVPNAWDNDQKSSIERPSIDNWTHPPSGLLIELENLTLNSMGKGSMGKGSMGKGKGKDTVDYNDQILHVGTSSTPEELDFSMTCQLEGDYRFLQLRAIYDGLPESEFKTTIKHQLAEYKNAVEGGAEQSELEEWETDIKVLYETVTQGGIFPGEENEV